MADDITAEELQRRWEARRQGPEAQPGANPDADRPSSTNEIVQVETRTLRCTDCTEAFEAKVITGPSGEPFAKTRICPGCVEKRDAAERKQREAEERESRERAAKVREEQLLELLNAAGANPWEHGRCTLANFDRSEAGQNPVTAVREFVDAAKAAGKYDPVRGLYLFGDTGAGKSHLAVAAARELVLDPAFPARGLVFDHALSLITRIQDTYNTRESTEAILDRRIQARVWILDDLGSEKASDDVVRRLTMIFTERVGRPTLVTSNDAPERLESRHPEYFRLQSRLGTANFRTVRVRGRDRRFDDPEATAA